MKSHWDNIVAETARDSRKRRGSEDQSEISVYSDLAGNIFNDLALTNDDDSGNDADNTEMSVRITIEEEDNEDDEDEANAHLGGGKNNDEECDDDDDDDVDEKSNDGDEEDDDDNEEAEDDGEEDDNEEEIEDADDEGDEDNNDEDDDQAGDSNNVIRKSNDVNNEDNPSEEYDDPSDEYDHSDGSPDAHESRRSFFDDPQNKVSQRSRKSSVCSSTQTQTQTQNETSCRSRWCTIIYNALSYYPVFIIFITLLNWFFFFGGIISMNPHPRITLKEPLSPSLSSFPFLTIHSWPTCSDQHDHWRLVSSQFTHQGIQHIGGYTALGLIYGVILESTHPFRSFLTAIVYEAAVIFGCLGHSFISPFDGLIGSSTGVYGLIGCSISHLVLNEDKLERRVYYGLGAILVLQGTFEIVSYFIWYGTDTAYAAHFTSLFVGLFIGVSFGITEPKMWKRVIGALGISAFCILTISLIVHYSSNLLRDLSYNLFPGKSCCKRLFDSISPNLSFADARRTIVCDAPSIQIKK